jgi:hypothetical protein
MRNHVSTWGEVGPLEALDDSADVFVPKKPLCWIHILVQNIRGTFVKCLHSSFRSG